MRADYLLGNAAGHRTSQIDADDKVHNQTDNHYQEPEEKKEQELLVEPLLHGLAECF